MVSDGFRRFLTVFGPFRMVSDRFRTVSDRFRTVSDGFGSFSDGFGPKNTPIFVRIRARRGQKILHFLFVSGHGGAEKYFNF